MSASWARTAVACPARANSDLQRKQWFDTRRYVSSLRVKAQSSSS